MEWFSNIPLFSKGYWAIRENQKKFIEAFASENRIINPQDWGRITYYHFVDAGGASLLNHFGNSIFGMLQILYPEIAWKRSWFPHIPLLPRSYWNKKENQKEFMDQVAIQYGIQKATDWQRITLTLIKNKGGSVRNILSL